MSSAWTASTDADCANNLFNLSTSPDVFSSKPFVIAGFAYDCVVALAAAMHSAGDNANGSKVFEAFTNVRFEGATGTVAFDSQGDRLTSTVRYAVDLWRNSGSELSVTSVGSFRASSGYTSVDDSITWPKDNYVLPEALCTAEDFEYAVAVSRLPPTHTLSLCRSLHPRLPISRPIVSECEGMQRKVTFSWTESSNCTIGRLPTSDGGVLPADRSIECEYLQRGDPVVYVMYSLAGIAMLSFIVALALLVRLRHEPAVRRGQPLFLSLMAVGGVVSLVPIFLIPGEPTGTNCFAPTVVVVFGFTLTFGCLLLKTYRIYQLLEAARLMHNFALTTKSMAWRLCLLLLIDAVVLVVWGLIARPRPTVVLRDVSGVGLVAMQSCTDGMASDLFLAGVYLYKLALTLVMCYMAFHTRNMSADYSEGKFMFISSHELLLCSLIIVPLTHTVAANWPGAKYGLQSVGLLLVTSVCILLTLGTKIRLALMGTTATEQSADTMAAAMSPERRAAANTPPRFTDVEGSTSAGPGRGTSMTSMSSSTSRHGGYTKNDDRAALIAQVDLLSAHNAALWEQIKVLTKANAAPPTKPASRTLASIAAPIRSRVPRGKGRGERDRSAAETREGECSDSDESRSSGRSDVPWRPPDKRRDASI